MIVEVVAVGTELLLGQIINTNAATIGSALADSGFDAHYQQVVGDNLERMEHSIGAAMGRADAVIITGGIGPTRDDLTREAIAAATGRRLQRDEDYAAELRARFERAGRRYPESNARQADYPEGGALLTNPKGSAPGIGLFDNGTWIFAIPGVPEEMEYLLRAEVLPRLRRAAGGEGQVLVSRVLRTWGRSESEVGERLDDLYASSNPSIAFLASAGEIKVRITAKAPDTDSAAEMIEPLEAEVRSRLGASVFGVDDETIEPVLLRAVADRGWTIGTAESATGGMVAARMTSVPGSSRVYRGSIVAYATDLKQRLLGVEASMLEAGVITEQTARAMAESACSVMAVNVAVSVVGSAGPEPQEQQVGTIIVGVATPEDSGVRTLRLPGDRERIRTYGTTAALHLSRLAVTGAWWRR